MWTRRSLVLIALLLGVGPAWAQTPTIKPLHIFHEAATALGDGTPLAVAGWATVGVQVVITSAATVTFETTADDSTWNAHLCLLVTDQTTSSAPTVSGLYQCSVAGLSQLRARISSYGSGSVTVTGLTTIVAQSSGGGSVAVGDVTNDGPFAVQEDGAALTALQLIDNIVIAEDSAHTNLEGLAKVGCVQQATVANLAGTDLDWQPMTCKDGALSVHIATSAVGGTSADDDGSIPSGTTGITQVVNHPYAYNGTAWVRVTQDPCSTIAPTPIPIDIVTATTTELTGALAGASNHYYICSLDLYTDAANDVALVDDDTDGCGSPTSGLAGGVTAAEGWNFAASSGLVKHGAGHMVYRTNGTNRVVCLITSAATQLSGSIQVVAAP